jgi:hypothetical protein
MKRFVTGQACGQATLFPERLDDFIAEDNPVRVVDVYVEELDLRDLGFTRVDPLATGRPAYHPAVLLELYIYGYLNRAQLATMAGKAREAIGTEHLTAVADRGYYKGDALPASALLLTGPSKRPSRARAIRPAGVRMRGRVDP